MEFGGLKYSNWKVYRIYYTTEAKVEDSTIEDTIKAIERLMSDRDRVYKNRRHKIVNLIHEVDRWGNPLSQSNIGIVEILAIPNCLWTR